MRLPAIYRLVSNVAWITIVFFLLKAGNWIVLTDIPGTSAESYRRTVEILNHSLIYALIGLSMVAAYDIFRHLRRLFGTQKNHAPSTTAINTSSRGRPRRICCASLGGIFPLVVV